MEKVVGILFLVLFIFINQVLNTHLNYRPVIGILAQETKKGNIHGPSFIPATYFKYVEMGGARAVPVRINQSDEYYEDLFSQMNGVLFPGGVAGILTSGYAKAAQKLYSMALKANKNGDYFPMWGTCQGFQLLTALTVGKNVLSGCDGDKYSIPLILEKGYENSRIFKEIPDSLLKIITTQNVTGNFHHYCFTSKTYNSIQELRTFYKILSTNTDKSGAEFISTMEAYDYPIYGTQWHPEVNVFNWNMNYDAFVDRSINGVMVSQYFANFFVQEARKSKHTFSTEKIASEDVIENYKPVFEGEPTYEDIYYFDI